jgi:hypothetical protein
MLGRSHLPLLAKYSLLAWLVTGTTASSLFPLSTFNFDLVELELLPYAPDHCTAHFPPNLIFTKSRLAAFAFQGLASRHLHSLLDGYT